jgi:hypothetical protein
MFTDLLQYVVEKTDWDKWVCFDFDGVCSVYNEDFERNKFGPPVPGMAEAVAKIRSLGFKCTLFTTREITPELKDWLHENNFEFDSINSTEHNPEDSDDAKPIAVLYVDDKGLRFDQKDPAASIADIYQKLGISENLVQHAEVELRKAGLFDKDSDYDGMLGQAVLELMKVFAKQGHSGFSAQCTRELFNQLADYKPLSPITDDPNEWMDVSDYGGPNDTPISQSTRNSSLFSNDGGKTYYSIDDPKRELVNSAPYKEIQHVS